jgi:hypothetical protein
LGRYNQDFGTRITKADLQGKKIYDLVGPGRAAAPRAYLDHPEFFLNLPLMERSQTVVKCRDWWRGSFPRGTTYVPAS